MLIAFFTIALAKQMKLVLYNRTASDGISPVMIFIVKPVEMLSSFKISWHLF